MSNLPIEDEQLRKGLATLVHLHHYGFCEGVISKCYKSSREKWNPACEARAKQYEDKLVDFIHHYATKRDLEQTAKELLHWARFFEDPSMNAMTPSERLRERAEELELKAQKEQESK